MLLACVRYGRGREGGRCDMILYLFIFILLSNINLFQLHLPVLQLLLLLVLLALSVDGWVRFATRTRLGNRGAGWVGVLLLKTVVLWSWCAKIVVARGRQETFFNPVSQGDKPPWWVPISHRGIEDERV